MGAVFVAEGRGTAAWTAGVGAGARGRGTVGVEDAFDVGAVGFDGGIRWEGKILRGVDCDC